MLGAAFTKTKTVHNITYSNSSICDLRDRKETLALFDKVKPDWVVHLAAKVGGIKANIEHMGEFYRDNILLNTNVLEASRLLGVQKVVSVLSTCIYPDDVTYPLTENQIHQGPPHSSNYAYAHAKRMIDVQSRAYRKQYGCNFITAVPNNLFGENDNYHLNDSHVIPAIIHKMFLAKQKNEDVVLWGNGSPLREFTYSVDVAHILLFLLRRYDGESPINVGNPGEHSIKKIAELIAKYMNFKGSIIWDVSKPSGQHRKPSDNTKLMNLDPDPQIYTNFEKALRESCEWFVKNYPNVRGCK